MSWSLPFYAHLGVQDPLEPLLKHTAGSVDPADQVRCAARLGFAGVEDNLLVLRSEDDQRRIGEALKQTGLAMGCFVFAMGARREPIWNAAGDRAEARLRAEFDACAAAACRTGGRHVTVITARDPEEESHERQVDRYVANLKRYAPFAQDAGLTLCIEAHSPQRPEMLLTSVDEAHRMVQAVDSPAVRMVFDTGHAYWVGDVVEAFKACAPMVAAIQLADMPGRTEMGSGEMDFVGLLSAAQAMGFSGPYELEHALSQPGRAGEDRLIRLLTDIDVAVRARVVSTRK